MSGRPHMFPALIAAIMLLVAIAPLPYGYYQAMRWVVCGIAIYIAYKSFRWGKRWAIWLLGAIAILFNPILPIYLSREAWQPIDIVCAILFGLTIILLREPKQKVASNMEAQEE